MPETRRIGILGGTFDPIHRGHMDMGAAAQRALGLTRVHVITANMPPHRGQPAASSFHRFAMTAIAVSGLDGWVASDLELRMPPPSFTSNTLKRFHERGYRPVELFFVIGADAFAEIGNWRDYPQILDAAHFAVVSRPGHPAKELGQRLPMLAPRMTHSAGDAASAPTSIFLIDEATADVSSSAIRDARARGLSIAGMVPAGVQQHIEQHGLYVPMPPGQRACDARPTVAAGRLHEQESADHID
jgi:nicotinate-nucleotide adenylyltransferase